MRQEFTANVSHELKTPLTSISGYAEMIETGLAQPEDIPVFVHIYEVTSPGIDTDAFDMDAALRHEFQSGDNLIEEGEDVPIEVIAGLDESVVEAGEFFQFELALSQTSQDGSATGSTQVYGKEVFLLFHFYSVYFKLLLFVYGCKDRMKTQEGTIENDIRA